MRRIHEIDKMLKAFGKKTFPTRSNSFAWQLFFAEKNRFLVLQNWLTQSKSWSHAREPFHFLIVKIEFDYWIRLLNSTISTSRIWNGKLTEPFSISLCFVGLFKNKKIFLEIIPFNLKTTNFLELESVLWLAFTKVTLVKILYLGLLNLQSQVGWGKRSNDRLEMNFVSKKICEVEKKLGKWSRWIKIQIDIDSKRYEFIQNEKGYELQRMKEMQPLDATSSRIIIAPVLWALFMAFQFRQVLKAFTTDCAS